MWTREKTQAAWHGWLIGGVALALAGAGCSLDKKTIPELDGPSELGTSIELRANPDVITADGHSTVIVEAIVRDQNGQRAQGRAILFSIADSLGRGADIGQLALLDGSPVRAAEAIVNSDGDGVARVVYYAPYRTDITADTSVLVQARPVGTDANAAVYRTVRIELRSAEPRLFPQVPGNSPPTCSFLVEPSVGPFRVNQVISFQSTASDTDGYIVRYEWDFGDGTKEDKPDAAHVYKFAGSFTVTHVCTDNLGGQGPFSATLTVIP